MSPEASYADVTAEDESRGSEALASGLVAFVVVAGDVGPDDKDIGLGISWLSWMLMLAGGLSVLVMVAPGRLETYGEHVRSIAVGPKTRGTFFEGTSLGHALAEEGVLADNPAVEHLVVCDGSNLLGAPHPGIVGWYLRNGCVPAAEAVELAGGGRLLTGCCVVPVGKALESRFGLTSLLADPGTRLIVVPPEARFLPTDTPEELERARTVLAAYRG